MFGSCSNSTLPPKNWHVRWKWTISIRNASSNHWFWELLLLSGSTKWPYSLAPSLQVKILNRFPRLFAWLLWMKRWSACPFCKSEAVFFTVRHCKITFTEANMATAKRHDRNWPVERPKAFAWLNSWTWQGHSLYNALGYSFNALWILKEIAYKSCREGGLRIVPHCRAGL